MRWFVGVFVSSLMVGSVLAQSNGWNSISLTGDYQSDQGFIEIGSSHGLVNVYVIVRTWDGLRGVEFAAPPPDCPGLVFMGATPVFPSTVGTIETGVSIDFGACMPDLTVVMAINFFNSGIDSCCPWGVIAHQNSISGQIEGFDCQSNLVSVEGRMSTLRPFGATDCGHPTMPENPSPADGAKDQPLLVTLDWESQPTAGTGCGVFFANVEFGTTPSAPVEFWNVDPPQVAGPLEPNTTYYWRVTSVVAAYGSTAGPWWQFTTREDVAVQKSTWGAIKSLYRH